jgi:hypothetical protein
MLCVEVFRERVFMVAMKQHCGKSHILEAACSKVIFQSDQSVNSGPDFYEIGVEVCLSFLEGMELKTNEQIQRQANSLWNPLGRVPVHDWLLRASTLSQVDCNRLEALGNVVMPACASLALHLMGHSVGDFHQRD